MISRSTALALAELFTSLFQKLVRTGTPERPQAVYVPDPERIYEFLYERDFPAWFCNAARAAADADESRPVKDFILKTHTGESFYPADSVWTPEQVDDHAQALLTKLAADLLNCWNHTCKVYEKKSTRKGYLELLRRLELDGYSYRDPILLEPPVDEPASEIERGIIQHLLHELQIESNTQVLQLLEVSEEAYLDGDWEQSLHYARKFMEQIFKEAAVAHSERCADINPPPKTASLNIYLNYLQRKDLLHDHENQLVLTTWKSLQTNGNSNRPSAEGTRLLRRLALTCVQIPLLRLQNNYAAN